MQLNSKNNSILIFSDPHQNIEKVNTILKKEKYDIAVCLGDWFDSKYLDTIFDTEKTCNFLREWLFKDNFYTCIGNHDISYFFDKNIHVLNNGFSSQKNAVFQSNFSSILDQIKEKFLWYLWIDDFLCSHAGIHPTFLPFYLNAVNKKDLSFWLNNQVMIANEKLNALEKFWLYSAGRARGGKEKFGGILWVDFKKEFEPIEGLKQIVGHTFQKGITIHYEDQALSIQEANNICIDCKLDQYLIIKNGNIKIKYYEDL